MGAFKTDRMPRRAVAYDPATGAITRKGKRSDSVKGKYRIVGCKGGYTYAHRLAWRLHYGEWPASEIDHINGDSTDNRIENLRLADRAGNNQHRGKFQNNSSGEPNVSWDKKSGGWRVDVMVRWFRTSHRASHFISAVCAARLIRRTLHGEFATNR
jgi:hypothetical protein